MAGGTTVQSTTVIEHFNPGIGALYRPLFLHMLPALVHHTVVNTLNSSWNLNPSGTEG
jgi:hypothetical protein